MEFTHVIAQRRMVRAYHPDPVSEASLDRILAAGMSSPTAGNSGGVSLIAVTGAEQRGRIAVAAGEEAFAARGFPRWLSTAPVHVVPCVSPEIYRDRYAELDKGGADPDGWAAPYWWIDGGAVLMAILLAAVDEGLGAGFLGEHAIPDLARVLSIPEDTKPIGVITIGHPDLQADRPSGSLQRAPSRSRIHRERWSQ